LIIQYLEQRPSWMTWKLFVSIFEFVESFENKDGAIVPWDREAVATNYWTFVMELYGNLEARFHANIWTMK